MLIKPIFEPVINNNFFILFAKFKAGAFIALIKFKLGGLATVGVAYTILIISI